MKKIVFSIVLFLAWTGVVLANNDAVPVPEYRPGEYWEYEVIEERTQIGGSGSAFQSGTYKMEILKDGKMNLDPSFAMYFPSLYKGPPTTQSEVEWYRSFKVGETWKVRWVLGRWFYGTITVVAEETTTVPAGTFKTYKFVLKEDEGGRTYATYEYYFAPAAKATVRVYETRFVNVSKDVVYTREAKLTSFNVVRP